MPQMFKKLSCSMPNYSVVIEDDGRVAYAYLVNDDSIVSDVWLYNNDKTPSHVNWRDKSNMPFLNPEAYVINMSIKPLLKSDNICIENIEEGGRHGAVIYLRGKRFAKLLDGAKPGWSLLAKQDGPLANRLDQ